VGEHRCNGYRACQRAQGGSGVKLSQREPGPVAVRKGIDSLIAGLNRRDRVSRWRVSSPPDRLEGTGAMGTGDVDDASVAGPDDQNTVIDIGTARSTPDEGEPDHPREQVA
jgi:hypothetical protein